MYQSLHRHSPDAVLIAFCFDDRSENALKAMKLKNVFVVGLAEFENKKILNIKSSRSPGEYCWTCKASAIKYVMDRFNAESCTYIDADLYFFSSPNVIEEELKKCSVILTPHDFTEKYDTSSLNGVYCAQFIGFMNNIEGVSILNWWEDSCIDWCFARHEDNKYGDQKYLETMSEISSVGITKQKGVLGPWNMQKYSYTVSNGKLCASSLDGKNQYEVIFFHFHGFKFEKSLKRLNLGNYDIPKSAIKNIYLEYARHLTLVEKMLFSQFSISAFDMNKEKFNFKNVLRRIRQKFTGKPFLISNDNSILK